MGDQSTPSLEDQLRSQWSGDWNINGVDRASELARLLRGNGINNLSDINWQSGTQSVDMPHGGSAGRETWENGAPTYATDMPSLTMNGVGWLGSVNNDDSLAGVGTSGDKPYAVDIGNGAYDLGWSAKGHGNVTYTAQKGPDGQFRLVPVWGSSSDMKDVRTGAKMIATALGGVYGGDWADAISGALGGAAAGEGAGAGVGTLSAAEPGITSLAAQGLSPEALGLGSATTSGATAGTGLVGAGSGVTAMAPEAIGTIAPGVSASELSALSAELPGQVVGKTLGDYALQGATRGAISGGLNSAAHGGDFSDILKGAALGGTVGAATGTIGSGAGQFNVGGELGASGATSNVINGVGRGIIGGAINSTATGKDFDPTGVLAGGAGSYASGLGVGQGLGLDGDWAKGVDSALGSGVSTAIKGGNVTGALVNSAGGSAFNGAANWLTAPGDQHFLSDTPAVTPIQREDLSLPASNPIDYSNLTLPGDEHMADDTETMNWDPSDLDTTTQNIFQQNQQQNQDALNQGAQDISDQVGDPTLTQGGLDGYLTSLTDQGTSLGLGGSIMNAINGLGSWANNNKSLAALLAGGISSYANAARQDKLYQRALDEQHAQQQNYRNSVAGLRAPPLGIIGTHALRRTDGTHVFGTGANAGKLNVGG